jgi:hypothetical protein
VSAVRWGLRSSIQFIMHAKCLQVRSRSQRVRWQTEAAYLY